jgi:hypothetical protein
MRTPNVAFLVINEGKNPVEEFLAILAEELIVGHRASNKGWENSKPRDRRGSTHAKPYTHNWSMSAMGMLRQSDTSHDASTGPGSTTVEHGARTLAFEEAPM